MTRRGQCRQLRYRALASDTAAAQKHETIAEARGVGDLVDGKKQGSTESDMLAQRSLEFPTLTQVQALKGLVNNHQRLWREQATRCIALTPAQMGATRCPAGAPSLSCTAEEDALPFADLMFDRVLLVHGLEAAESARRMAAA